jgi:hypothetical protein
MNIYKQLTPNIFNVSSCWRIGNLLTDNVICDYCNFALDNNMIASHTAYGSISCIECKYFLQLKMYKMINICIGSNYILNIINNKYHGTEIYFPYNYTTLDIAKLTMNIKTKINELVNESLKKSINYEFNIQITPNRITSIICISCVFSKNIEL